MNDPAAIPGTDDDDMPSEIDFSKGIRGKFYRAGAKFILPAQAASTAGNEPRRPPATPEANRIDAEGSQPKEQPMHESEGNSLFGMWADRTDMDDVPAYVRGIRAGRFDADGTRGDDSRSGLIEANLIEKLKQLPPHRVAQVLDFVDFLLRQEERASAALRLTEAQQKIDALGLPPFSD